MSRKMQNAIRKRYEGDTRRDLLYSEFPDPATFEEYDAPSLQEGSHSKKNIKQTP